MAGPAISAAPLRSLASPAPRRAAAARPCSSGRTALLGRPPAIKVCCFAENDKTDEMRAAVASVLKNYYAAAPTAARVVARLMGRKDAASSPEQLAGLQAALKEPDPWPPLDHFAFRSFGLPGLGISTFESLVRPYGYVRRGELTFPKKKLKAAWFAPPEKRYEDLPRVFYSELEVEKLSPAAQDIIGRYASADTTPLRLRNAILQVEDPVMWQPPAWDDYSALLQETEYGAWVLANGCALNHAAISVHRLGRPLEGFIEELQASGIKFNTEGGLVKVSDDGGLRQAATVADSVKFLFDDSQVREVAGPYIEFVERLPLPEFVHLPHDKLSERQRRDGFEEGNAANIFESTKNVQR